jgi:HK97 family phage portal protein
MANQLAMLSPPAHLSPPRGLRNRIRAALAGWVGLPIQLTDHAFWAEFTSGMVHSGERVTVDTALRMSAVWACVRLISETVGTLPIMLYRRQPERTVATKHPLYLILHDSPNADMTAVSFWEVMLASLLLWGNCYALIVRAAGVVVALEFVPPGGVVIRRQPDGSLLYIWHDFMGRVYESNEDDMLHVPAFTMNGLVGLSPIAYANNVLGNAIAADKASGTVFRNGLLMGGTFETPNTVPEKLRATFQTRLEEYRGSINAGKAPLLEAGIKYNAIAINPEDAQLLQTRAFSIEEICRWYRVPPFMVGHSEKSTSWGTGIEQQMIGFLTFTLRPWLKRIEQTINRKLLTAAERMDLYAEFNFEALLRADSAARSAFYSTMVQNGIYTRDECRVKENLAPRGGGADELTAQVNLAPLDQLGAAPQDASAMQARNAFRTWLGIDSEQNAAQPIAATTEQ